MLKIVKKDVLNINTVALEIEAPMIAAKGQAGQFVMVRLNEHGERFPLTLADFDRQAGTITLVVLGIGNSTNAMIALEAGEYIMDIAGPLGHPTEIPDGGKTVVCVGGGVGVATVYPVARAMQKQGNNVTVIIGARTKDMLPWGDRFSDHFDHVIVTTDDGSAGKQGFVTGALQELVDASDPIDLVFAVGPTIMMKAVTETTRSKNIQTLVSLNPIMVDGTGMCGGCRVNIGGEARFVCVDGPDFDAHQVDFDDLMDRQKTFEFEEKHAPHECLVGGFTESRPLELPGLEFGKRQEMPVQDPESRRGNFEEVALGYSEERTLAEAARCLQCKKPKCVEGCPVSVDIPAFIGLIKEKDYKGALAKIKETNALPAVCGRVCPQESQCEVKCVIGRKGQPVAIGRLERFVADRIAAEGSEEVPTLPAKNGKTVALVGSGPASLAAAGDLIKLGYKVDLLEALHDTGGVLSYGIPEFRLPKKIVSREVEYLAKLGVNIKTNIVVGRTITIGELQNQYDSIFIGVGAGLPVFKGIPGEQLKGVYSANEYLTRVNLMKAYAYGEYDTPVTRAKWVFVTGGGNVAMDAVRTALRLGAERAMILYRRTRNEMPARVEEVEHAEEEGVEFKFLVDPIRVIGDDDGWVMGIECLRMELGEPDDSGRRRPVVIEGSNFIMKADVFVVAISTRSNPIIADTTPGLKFNKWGYIEVDPETCATSLEGVFAGGDITTGSATVISAMGMGRKAAKSMHEFLQGSPKKQAV